MKSEEIYKCDECGDDVCNFDHIIQVEVIFCNSCTSIIAGEY